MDNIKNKEEEFTIPIYDETNTKVGTVVGIVGDVAYQQICEENGGTLPQRIDVDLSYEGNNPFKQPKPKGERMGWKRIDEPQAPPIINGKKVQIDGQSTYTVLIP
jgi:rRNA processing protein Gar1